MVSADAFGKAEGRQAILYTLPYTPLSENRPWREDLQGDLFSWRRAATQQEGDREGEREEWDPEPEVCVLCLMP